VTVTKITRRALASINVARSATMLYDTDLPGFGIRLAPTGRRSWFVEYRSGAGGRLVPKRRYVFGTAATMTPERARREAKQLLAAIRLGNDPAERRNRDRRMPTFADFMMRTLDAADEIARAHPREARLRPGTIRNYRSLLKKHLAPAFGNAKLDKISTAEVQRLHRKLGLTKPTTANRTLESTGSVFKEAARQGLVPHGTNPARGIPAFREPRRERFLSADELARLGEALRRAEAEGIEWEVDETKPGAKHLPRIEHRREKIDAFAAAAIRLLIFTGARLREVLSAKWVDVNFEQGLLSAAGKTGQRYIVLPAPALAILSELPHTSDWIFPGIDPRAGPRGGLSRPWRLVRRAAGLQGVRLHDLRHSFASVAAGAGSSLPIIGRLLGHSQPSSTARYSHLADDPVRSVAERVSRTIANALDGPAAGPTVSIRRARRV
jgi:integrase